MYTRRWTYPKMENNVADAIFEYSAPGALGQVRTLPQFLEAAGNLTLEEQKLIVQQALNLIEDVYVQIGRAHV